MYPYDQSKLARVDPEYDTGDHISAEVLGQMTDDALFELHSYMRETLSLLVAGRK